MQRINKGIRRYFDFPGWIKHKQYDYTKIEDTKCIIQEHDKF